MVDNFGKLLFGSIKKKLNWAFGFLIVLLVIIVAISYILNQQISTDQNALRDIEAPLEFMVQEVIGYDAILTGAAHEALLHTEREEYGKLAEHKAKYDDAGVKLDNLLKIDAIRLVNQSKRSSEEKRETYDLLLKLDEINLKLVDLEVGAFEAMEKGDPEIARNLIVSNQYEEYKAELAALYNEWNNIEIEISEGYRQNILKNSRRVQIYNIVLGILFVIFAIIIPFIVNRKIVNPINEMHGATLELERGNLKARVNVTTGDELEDLGNEFNKMAEQLEKVDQERKGIDKAKTEFLSITSHELRSPMTPMRAQLQMLEKDYFGKMNSKQKDALNIVLRNTERLDRILLDFLEISRIEAARLKFNFVKVSLNSAVHAVIEEMKGFMPEKKIKIIADIGKLPVIEVDPDRVMQVLRNLLNNAIKFSRENGRIDVSAMLRGNYIEFIVKDNGLGIKAESQSRIFEPFFQAENMYQHISGGTGLGLAICKGIIEGQKGKIWFNSVEGRGTTFHFTVPLTPTKEMAPIKLLFSPKADIENKVKEVLVEYLGPLGTKEFEDLKLRGLTEEILDEYIVDLHKKGIITRTEEFKRNIRNILSGEKEKVGKRKEGVGISDLKKEGLIR